MKKYKKYQNDAVRAYREYIEHLRHEIHKKDRDMEKLVALRDKLLSENAELREDAVLLEADNARLAAENDALKGHGRLFTDLPGKAERLEMKLMSALERVDELSEKNETLQTKYDEATQAVKELTDENTMLKAKLKHFHTIERRAQFECARANELEEKIKKAEKGTTSPISREQAEEIFFGKEQKDGENDDC